MRAELDTQSELHERPVGRPDPHRICSYLRGRGHDSQDGVARARWHDWLEILYVESGAVTVSNELHSFELKEGDAAIICIHALHAVVARSEHHVIRCVSVDVGFVMQYIHFGYLYGPVYPIYGAPGLVGHLDAIEKLVARDDPVAQMELAGNLLLLLSEVMKVMVAAKDEVATGSWSSVFGEILRYVNARCTEPLSLNEVAAAFEFTPQYISQLFKHHMHTTFRTYLTSLRTNRARFLLSHTDQRIIEIAYSCGFGSENTMISTFKRSFGQTPTQYRRTHRRRMSP